VVAFSFFQRLSFRTKLVGAFLLVILVSVALVYWLTERNVTQQFSRFTSSRFAAGATALAPIFVNYYEQNGGWQGIEHVLRPRALEQLRRQGGPVNPGQVYLAVFTFRENLILADSQGQVVFNADASLVGKRLPEDVLAQGIPLLSGGQRVGTLLSGVMLARFAPVAQQFLHSLNRSTLLAGLLAALAALGVGVILVRQLAHPIDAVTRAVERIAAGNFDQQLEVTSQDKIGQLAQAFNTMSSKLKQSEQLRQQMTADVAHELRTPLSVIQGDLEALIDGVYPANQATFQSLLEEAGRLSSLIDELRELSLLAAGELRLDKTVTDLGLVAQQLVQAFRPKAQAKGVQLDCQAEPHLPTLELDEGRIAQVLRNLLSNALRHTPEGGQVGLSLRFEGEAIQCAVSDTGLGMPEQELANVFERFWRADEARARFSGGSGLGLSICKALVEAHGGRMWAKSVEGEGSVFGFCLPVSRSEPRGESEDPGDAEVPPS